MSPPRNSNPATPDAFDAALGVRSARKTARICVCDSVAFDAVAFDAVAFDAVAFDPS